MHLWPITATDGVGIDGYHEEDSVLFSLQNSKRLATARQVGLAVLGAIRDLSWLMVGSKRPTGLWIGKKLAGDCTRKTERQFMDFSATRRIGQPAARCWSCVRPIG